MASDDSYYILRYHADAVQEATSTNQGIDEDGIEAAFDVSWAFERKREGEVRIFCTLMFMGGNLDLGYFYFDIYILCSLVDR